VSEEAAPGQAAPQGQGQPPVALLVAVFLTAMAVLGFEVALTRAFSVLLRFHFVFLAISLATCGLGLGGLLDFGMRRRLGQALDPLAFLVASATACAVLMPVTFVALFASKLSAHLTSVWVVSALCLPPYLAAGAFLSHAFAWRFSHGGRMYFADLTGAALGSFLVIGGLQVLGGINCGILWGSVVGAGAVALAVGQARRVRAVVPGLVSLAVIGLVVANHGGRLIDLPVLPLQDDPNAKPLYQELGDPSVGAKLVDTEWNAFARTDVVTNAGQDDLYLYTDGEVPTNMIKFDGDLRALAPRLASFLGFYAFHETRPERVLLIGPGGGLDILLALMVGAKQIDGAELNPSIPRLVRKYAGFTGHVYDLEGVNIRVDEGRSFVSRQQEKYDLIYMALTKTATTTSSSLALVESYIHTTEAFEAFTDRLTDRGAVAFVCQSPLILMRTMLTAVSALEHKGVSRQEALRHVCLLSVGREAMGLGPYRYMLMVGRQALTPGRARELATHCIAMRYEPVFFPGAYEPAPFSQLTRAGLGDREFVDWWNKWQGRAGSRRMDFMPCPDDRPFVVDMSVGVPPQFLGFLWAAVGLAVVLTVVALTLLRRSQPEGLPGAGRLAAAALYFGCLGIGFMLVEIVLTQRLVLYLGYPVLTLSVILFSLLLGGGLGSLWSQSWAPGRGLALRAASAAAGVAALALLVSWLQPGLVHATLRWSLPLRCAVTMGLLVPLGFLMGTPFPTGVRVVGAWTAELVPWMWGLNGLTSVVGSVAAMSVAKLCGFTSVLYVGAGVYGVASLLGYLHYHTAPAGDGCPAGALALTEPVEGPTEAARTKADDE
jgi:hypothetical protein